MSPYNPALAALILADGDPRGEHPDSRDTLAALEMWRDEMEEALEPDKGVERREDL